MEVQSENQAASEVIHLFDSVRDKVNQICAEEGATFNEFINVAVAEKLAHYAHIEWVKNRKPPTEEGILEARRILRKAGNNPPDPGDELPEGYIWPTKL